MKELLVILNIPACDTLSDVKRAVSDIYLSQVTGHLIFASTNADILLEIRKSSDTMKYFMYSWSSEVLHVSSETAIVDRVRMSSEKYLLVSGSSYELENNVSSSLLSSASLNKGFGYIYPHIPGYDRYLCVGGVYEDDLVFESGVDLSKTKVNIDYSPSGVFLTTPRNYITDQALGGIRGISLRRLGMASILLPHTTVKKRKLET